MEVLFQHCESCRKHICQDTCGYQGNTLWVIDSIAEVFKSDYLSNSGDICWLVQELNKALKETDVSLPLKEFVYTAIETVRTKALAKASTISTVLPSKLPTFAFLCVRCNANTLDYLCLADCYLFFSRYPNLQYTDMRYLPFHLAVNAIKDQYK